VNMIYLSKKKRRMWLLWTIPAISLVACLIVWVYWFSSEGWNTFERTETLTVLDQVSQDASTIGRTAFYSSITPGEGLHFSAETEVTPEVEVNSWMRDSSARTVHWSQDQHLARGWITARVPAHFVLRKTSVSVLERVRITFEDDGEGTALNGLGATIQKLTVCDHQGEIYEATNLAPGSSVKLTRTERTASGSHSALRDVYESTRWERAAKDVREEPEKYLQPGRYIATLGRSPFLKSALGGASNEDLKTVVYGIYKR
ncbi:MAG: hypothetical protein AAF517_24880, partial [Planctomycetota bacterium]